MLVMGMCILHILVAHRQLWRSLGHRGGPKTPPKNTKTTLKAIKWYTVEPLSKAPAYKAIFVYKAFEKNP